MNLNESTGTTITTAVSLTETSVRADVIAFAIAARQGAPVEPTLSSIRNALHSEGEDRCMGTVVGKAQDSQSEGFEEMHTSINIGRTCDEESSWAAGERQAAHVSYIITACA